MQKIDILQQLTMIQSAIVSFMILSVRLIYHSDYVSAISAIIDDRSDRHLRFQFSK